MFPRAFILFSLLVPFLASAGAATGTAPGTEMSPAEACRVVLVQLFQAGARLDKKGAVGFHGTSIEALEHARLTGHLSGGILNENAGGWYFYPNVNHPKVKELLRAGKVKLSENVIPGDEEDPVKDAWEGAVGYANRIAKLHRFMKELDLPFTDASQKAAEAYLSDPTDHDCRRKLVLAGADEKKIKAAFQTAQKAKGVVLAIGPQAIDEIPVTNAAPEDDGLRFDASHGIPVRILVAVEPLDDEEWQYFKDLQTGKRP